MLVYDICDSWSFNNVPKWLKDWRQHSEANSVSCLLETRVIGTIPARYPLGKRKLSQVSQLPQGKPGTIF
jgi:hypothetical protein